MTQEDFDKVVETRLAASAGILTGKGLEYVPDGSDCMGNFKMQAANWGVSPLVVWGIFLGKHMAAINTYVRTGVESSSEPIEGRIDDAINYLLLGAGLIQDMRATEAATPKRGRPVGSRTKPRPVGLPAYQMKCPGCGYEHQDGKFLGRGLAGIESRCDHCGFEFFQAPATNEAPAIDA